MPQRGIKPEDTYEMEIWLSNVEQTIGDVPSNKFARKIYGLTAIHHKDTATSSFTLRKYKGATLEKEWVFVVGAYDTLDISRPPESPFLTIEAGRTLKGITQQPTSIMLILQYYDL